ncbi:MAG: FkbM family methyltransferase [Rhodospirillaceae bacterium]|nr:FkbM family methyltransferase [Rhodospirillaceae bacterium]
MNGTSTNKLAGHEDWRSEAAYLGHGAPEICGHTFLAAPLGPGSIVVDLGGSTAAFSRAIAAQYGCICHVAEATAHNFQRIQESGHLTKYHRALGGADGPVDLLIADEGSHWGSLAPLGGTKYGASETVEGATLQGFLGEIGAAAPDLVKVDIEGAEIAMFAAAPNETLRSIGQMTVEFHDFMDPGNKRVAAEVATVKARLAGLGFYCFQFSHPHNGDVLFVNRARLELPWVRRIWYGSGLKYGRGMARMVARRLGVGG